LLEKADIFELEQLQGRRRREMGLFPKIGVNSLTTIEALLRDAGLAPLRD
jgi:hypothetical protein